jgi:hypothetical protein
MEQETPYTQALDAAKKVVQTYADSLSLDMFKNDPSTMQYTVQLTNDGLDNSNFQPLEHARKQLTTTSIAALQGATITYRRSNDTTKLGDLFELMDEFNDKKSIENTGFLLAANAFLTHLGLDRERILSENNRQL